MLFNSIQRLTHLSLLPIIHIFSSSLQNSFESDIELEPMHSLPFSLMPIYFLHYLAAVVEIRDYRMNILK